MTFMRVLGLVVAAVLLMGLAGTASATQVCKQVQSGGDGKCPGGPSERELAKGESITAAATDVVLTSLSSSVFCSRSSVRVQLASKNSISLLKGKVTALSFTDCATSGGTPCTVSVANLPYEVVLHKTDLLFFDGTGGVEMRVSCGYLVRCEFTVQEQLLEVEGDVLVADKERPATKKGLLCPLVPRLDATYTTGSRVTFAQ